MYMDEGVLGTVQSYFKYCIPALRLLVVIFDNLRSNTRCGFCLPRKPRRSLCSHLDQSCIVRCSLFGQSVVGEVRYLSWVDGGWALAPGRAT